MSTYEYYEFQAIDQPLSPEEQEAVARLSSRVDPHPRRAVFTYSWSSFRGDPAEILTAYYDAMLHIASWNYVRLMFRFPSAAMDLQGAQTYCQPRYVDEFISFSAVGEYVVLDIRFYGEEGVSRWVEGEGWLDALLPLRDDILRGDYRALDLAWLKTLEVEDVLGSVSEPPVPAGLSVLTPALRRFIELLEIDEMLVAVAAERSDKQHEASEERLRGAISELSREECDAYLLRLAQGEPHLGLSLKRRLRELAPGLWQERDASAGRRTVEQLLAETEWRWEQEQRRRAEEAERKRIAELEALAEREAEVWREVEALIVRMTGSAYADAVELLLKLRDLAVYKGQFAEYRQRLRDLRERNSRRRALMRRLQEAGL